MSNVISPSVNKRQTIHEIVRKEKKKKRKKVKWWRAAPDGTYHRKWVR